MNAYDTMRNAIAQAKEVNRAADDSANAMADLLDGRLKRVSRYRLARLKKQLRDFNIHTGLWKHE